MSKKKGKKKSVKRKKAHKKTDLNPKDIPIALETLLPPDKIRELAKETGFIEREKKIEAVAMIWTLVLGFGVRLKRTLASLKRIYQEETGTTISDSSWYDRFTPKLARFVKANVQLALTQMAGEANRKLSAKLKHFDDIMIQDSTVIRLHEALAKKWPATRARKTSAGVKVSTLISAVANGPKTVAIHGERTSEIKTLRIGPWVKNRIFLGDLGFYKHQLFARIDENGGFFVSRLKGTADPLIVAMNSTCRGNSIDIVGKKWKDIKDDLKRQVLDVEVEIKLTRRKYKGKQRKDTARFRLVAVYNKEERKYHAYLTNITTDVLCAEDIAALYRVRWEIELVFKELKSKYALDVIDTTKACIVEGLIWTAILTLLVSRRLYNLLLASAPLDKRARYTPLRWANTFAETGDSLLNAMLEHLGFGNSHGRGFDFIARLYEWFTLDPHVKRHRLSDGWWS
jgi:IS4 transposase